MSIVKRTVIMVLCTSIALFSLVYLLSNVFYVKGFKDLERQTVEKSTGQVTDALSAEISALNAFCKDWSNSDETYQFAQEYNREYVDSNFMDETFKNSELSAVIILNSQGEIIYSKAYDIINFREVDLTEDLPDILAANGLAQPVNLQQATSGVIMLAGQPTLIVSNPVLTGVAEGPSVGAFMMGRFLDAEVVSSLAATTHFTVDMLSMESVNQDPELDGIVQSLNNPGSVFVQAENSDVIDGYTLVNGLNKEPVLVFKVSMPRDIYSQGIKFTAYLHSCLLFIFIVFCIAFVLLMKKAVLSRLTALSKSVNAIGSKADLSRRVSVQGKDELSGLAHNINGMLESLEKLEARERSQKELISHILTNTPNPVMAIDENECVVLINNAFCTAFGANCSDIIGNRIDNIPNLAHLVQEIRAFLDSKSANSKREFQYRHNGYKKTFVASFTRMKENNLAILDFTDISEARAEQERLYLTDRLVSIGEMASGVAHELNNPLTSVIGLSEMLKAEKMPKNIREDVEIISSEAQRAAAIVKNLLSFSRKHTPLKRLTQINSIVEEVLKIRAYEHGVTNITVVRDLGPGLPEIMVDYFQMQQVFINIILNAEQAMLDAHGKGTLKITSERADNIIKVSFNDDGPGISPRHLSRLFDPFFTTKEVGKGTGLGLSICYGIITAHNGRIYARSEIGKGSTFIVELPINNTIPKEAPKHEQK